VPGCGSLCEGPMGAEACLCLIGKQRLVPVVGISRNLKESWSADFPGTIILPGGEILCGQQRKLGIKYIF